MTRNKKLALDFMLAGILFLLILFTLSLSSCKHEPEIIPLFPVSELPGNNGNPNNATTCDPDSVYFQTQILPLLQSNCAKSGCHTVEDHEDGVVLNSYQNVMATADVDPGDPGDSDLYEVLTETDPDKRMPPPPNGTLSSDQIQLIYDWIAQGAINNSCSSVCDTNNVTFSGTISPLLQGSCVGCHTGTSAGGSVRLDSYAGVLAVAQNGKLLGAVNHSPGFQPMPRGGNKLASCQIDQIRIWIEGGSQNN